MISLENELTNERIARQLAEQRLEQTKDLLEKQRQTLELALWASQEAVWEWSLETDTFCLTWFKRDRDKEHYSGKHTEYLSNVHPEDIPVLQQQLDLYCDNQSDAIDAAFRYYQRDGWCWLRMRGQASCRDTHGLPLKIIGTVKDISSQQEQLASLNKLARYDSLTGLLNRRTLLQELQKWVAQAVPFCLIFVDLDGFKQLNDTAGHNKGDEFLQQVAHTLRVELPLGALIGRFGGDEFVCVIPQTHWQQYVQRLVAVRTPFDTSSLQRSIRVTGSLGVSLFPEHSHKVDELIEFADAAMYMAKQSGKNNFALYQPELFEAQKRKNNMLSALVEALDQELLEFYLQPKFSHDERITGAELLCRWTHPVYGQITPAIFIPLIEQNGFSERLAVLALQQAARYQKQLIQCGIDITLAVNISAELVLVESFIQTASDIFDSNSIDKHSIELEVTESVFIQDAQQAELCLERLRTNNFRVAMDDFGTGYSSLSYVSRYHFDTIKIDQSFIKDMLQFAKARLLVEGIVSLCHTLGMNIVAEGVETKEQFDFLKQLGVQRFQGFLLGKPMPFEQLLAAFTRQSSPEDSV